MRLLSVTLILCGGLFASLPSFAEDNIPHPCHMRQTHERKMEVLFDRIVNKYEGEQNFLDKLAASQIAWAQYKSAQMAALFPNDTDDGYDPNVPLEVRCGKLNDLLVIRNNELAQWL